jgi:hypothetical protein
MHLFTIINCHFNAKTSLSNIVHKVIQDCLKQKTYYKKENIYLAVYMHRGFTVLEQSAYFRQNISYYEFQKSLILRRFKEKSTIYLPPETSFELLLAGIGGIHYNSSKTFEWLKESWRKDEIIASIFFVSAVIKTQKYKQYQSTTHLMLEFAIQNNLQYSFYLKGEISRLTSSENLTYLQKGVDESNCIFCEIKLLLHRTLFEGLRLDGIRSRQYLLRLKKRFNQAIKNNPIVNYSDLNSFLETIGYLSDVDFFVTKDFQRQINIIKNTPSFFTYYFLFKLYQKGDKNYKKSDIQSKYYLNKMLSLLPISYVDIVWNDALIEYNRENYTVSYYMFRAIEALTHTDYGKYYIAQCLIKSKCVDPKNINIAFEMLCFLKECSPDLSIRMSAGEVIHEYSYYLPLPKVT